MMKYANNEMEKSQAITIARHHTLYYLQNQVGNARDLMIVILLRKQTDYSLYQEVNQDVQIMKLR